MPNAAPGGHEEGGTHGAHAGHGLGHVSPFRNLMLVWGALTVLTVVTVWVATIDVGAFNLWVAMGIASVKASLVVLYFMHLRYDRPFNAIVLVSGIVFVTLMIGFTLLDATSYNDELIPDYVPALASTP